MPIAFYEDSKTFHLQTPGSSYLIKLTDTGYLLHLYYGRQLQTRSLDYLLRIPDYDRGSFIPITDQASNFCLGIARQEYPAFGNTDMRTPAVEVQQPDGSMLTDFRYASHRIFDGKPPLPGLPATYTESDAEAQTLEITLQDKLTGLTLLLLYTAFADYDAVACSARLVNNGPKAVQIKRMLSAAVDFTGQDYKMLKLPGGWARERHVDLSPLHAGMQAVESRLGASSHAFNPFIALLSPHADEQSGEAYGFSLVYSGSFFAGAEVDLYHNTRVLLGLSPFQFSWQLEPGAAFQTPEAVLVYSASGIGGMSRVYNNLYRSRLARGKFRDAARPVLINNWEATYFDFTGDKIRALAQQAAGLGVELLVLDDGWFGNRDSDDRALGDWFVNENKLGGSLHDLAADVNKLGMQFGLWFEPEMISPDSDLYRAHPDWCLHVPGRKRSLARNQLILDLTRREVCDAVVRMVCDVLSSAPISYVKWDMNRNFSEAGSPSLPAGRQGETAHRYMLGVYYMMETITARFPEILFESCSGGGGRFDPGMLYYMPQTWTSDDTDAIERLKIQFGTTMVYPTSAMACHVSAVPNHQVGRITPLTTRGIVAMSGQFGYELDPGKLSEQEKRQVKQQIALYKRIRGTVQFGDFYRIQSPFDGPTAAWCMVSKDKKQAVLSFVRAYAEPNQLAITVQAAGLDPDRVYRVSCAQTANQPETPLPNGFDPTSRTYTGSELLYAGLPVPEQQGDYQAAQWVLDAVG